MSDYISREDAIDIVRHECCEWRGLAKEIVKQFNGLPSADVAPVVRCKDCTRYIDLRHWCKCHDTTMFENDFCSYGGKREE